MPRRRTTAIVILSALVLASVAAQPAPPYRVISPDGARALPVQRVLGTTDFVALDALAQFFNLMMRDDARTRGVVLVVGTQRVALTEGQATVSAGGRLVSLSAPVTKDGSTWLVPIDFLRVLDPLLDRRIDIRRESRLIVLGTAVVPRITPRFERTASGSRLILTVDPSAQARVTREGNLVTVRFQADALDMTPLAGAPGEFVENVRVEGTSLFVDLGSAVSNVRQADAQDQSRITLDLIAAAQVAPTRPDPPLATITPDRPGTIRTVVIDPGHGGSDKGSRSASGLEEKQITLAVARRLEAVLESRLGLRVILTREGDVDVAIDRRAAIANNNKADVFISLHVNGSPNAALRGWQVQSLDPAQYNTTAVTGSGDDPDQTVPVVGGGLRTIGAVPWRLAQIPHASRSASLSNLLAAKFGEGGLAAQPVRVLQAPLRVLVGANMPAVLIELGFLTHAEEAAALGSTAFHVSIADMINAVINDVRSGWPGGGPGGGEDR